MNDASQKIDSYLASLPEWQKTNLQNFREIIRQADGTIIEDWKWNVPVFLLDGKTLFAMSAFKAHTKYNFILNGASIEDTDKLFNSGFDAKNSRGIDLKEHQTVDMGKLRSLVDGAVTLAKQ